MKKPKIILRQVQNDGERSRTITKEMTVKEVIEKYPKTASVFTNLGIYCFGCPVASFETIEEMAKNYKLDLKKLLENLNKAK